MASSVHHVPLAPGHRGEGFTEVLQDTVASEVPAFTFLLGSLALISSWWQSDISLENIPTFVRVMLLLIFLYL